MMLAIDNAFAYDKGVNYFARVRDSALIREFQRESASERAFLFMLPAGPTDLLITETFVNAFSST